jgi:hypothetical protein
MSKDLRCYPSAGSSSAPLPGSTAAEGLPRIGRTSIATHWLSCISPQSASCSENFAIVPDVSGQTLRGLLRTLMLAGGWGCRRRRRLCRFETPPPASPSISASRGGRCHAPGRIADRVGAGLSDEARAHHCQLCCRRHCRHPRALDRSDSIRPDRPCSHHRGSQRRFT